jgi:phosphate starvation-inducible protein PhoH and related proteins
MSEIILTIDGVDLLQLFGENNAKLNLVRKAFADLTITSRGNNLKIAGPKTEAQAAKDKIELMVRMLREHNELTFQTVEDMLHGANPYEVRLTNGASNVTIVFGKDGAPIKAKTKNQRKLVDASEQNDIVFAIGPAGTGKTYTAVALAVRALKNKTVKRIILTRPAVEAGENLGFLPGDLKEKVDPYLRPLYDALDDMFPADKLTQFMTNRVIEVAPLAFMRGRTLNDAFIILDEAQNTTTMQIKMFLTRIGPSAKCIITGDLSQIDLPRNIRSGLDQALYLLKDIDGIAQVQLTAEDVVRHRLVKEIIKAYDKNDEEVKRRNEEYADKRREDRQPRNEVVAPAPAVPPLTDTTQANE